MRTALCVVGLVILLAILACGGNGVDRQRDVTGANAGDHVAEATPVHSSPEARADRERTTADQPDDCAGCYQVHFVYVLCSDCHDYQKDIDGGIATSVAAFEKWLERQTGGRRLRVDTFQDSLDVTFLRLDRSDAEMRAQKDSILYTLEAQVRSRGFAERNKAYGVYYGGSAVATSCGGAGHKVAAMYLLGTTTSAATCALRLTASDNSPGYWEFAMLHDLLHVLGFVPACAPHVTHDGLMHVSDDPRDLMYAGGAPWQISDAQLDVGHDDYFEHHIQGCPDLAASAFLDPAAPDAVAPVGWPKRLSPAAQKLRDQALSNPIYSDRDGNAILAYGNPLGQGFEYEITYVGPDERFVIHISPADDAMRIQTDAEQYLLTTLFQTNDVATVCELRIDVDVANQPPAHPPSFCPPR